MKPGFKILKIFAVLLLAVFIILFSASLLMQDKVGSIILKSLNRNLSTKLTVRTFRLSFLKNFPKASLELKDVLAHSSSDFNSASFGTINTDTLLSAKAVSVVFRITDILTSHYTIEKIIARSGRVNIFTDAEGSVNYDVSVKKAVPEVSDFSLDLQKINMSDFKAYYNNLATRLIITGDIKSGTLKSRIQGENIDFTGVTKLKINSFQLYDTRITRTITADLDVNLRKSKTGILFKKSVMRIENFDLGLDGLVSAQDVLDLNVTGHNIDISKARKYLPEKYMSLASDYSPSGTLEIKGKIKGLLSRTKNPHVEIKFDLKNGHLAYSGSDLKLSGLSFTGNYSNGAANNPSTGSLSLKDFRAKLGSSEYTGSFTMTNFYDPHETLSIKGKVLPAEIREFFNLKELSTAGGYVDMDLKLSGQPDLKKKFGFSDLLGMNPVATLDFNSFSLGMHKDNMLFTDVNGNLLVSNTILARNFKLTYNTQKITVTGEFRNLPEWISGKPVQMSATADIAFSRLIPEMFIKNLPTSEVSSSKRSGYKLPENIVLDINFKIDSLNYRTFSSSKISGTFNYKPRILTFKSLNMKSLNGTISGNGFVLQNGNKTFLSKGIFNVTKIDINKTFTTFHNFSQNFLKAENIRGSLSGSFSLLLPMDSLLRPVINSITAEGKYVLVNGSLVNFEPVKQLSSFIELSELENISFEKMENDFFIRNETVYIPQMEVRSSAVDLSVNGQHKFNNDYEYHVKVLLSEILSKKRKKTRSNVTEFGIVEDDGLGRTSMLLKIVYKGEDIKVGYDLKAAASEVRNNMKTERKSLKTILNQEYGWFKTDSAKNPKPDPKKKHFQITWDDK